MADDRYHIPVLDTDPDLRRSIACRVRRGGINLALTELQPMSSHGPSQAAPADMRAPLPQELRRDIAARVAHDQVAMLHRLTIQPVVAGMVFSLLVGVVFWPLLAGPTFLSWVLARVTISLARLWDCHDFLARLPGVGESPKRRLRFLALMALECASWSAMGLLFTGAVPSGVALVILTGLVAVSAVSVFSLGSDFAASGLFVTIVLLPNAVAQWHRATPEALVTGGGMLIFLALLLLEARALAQRMTELLRLRHENAAIAEQRQRALVLAEHSSQAKSRFLATVSHEMRTPLNGILGMAQLLQREVEDAAQRSRIGIVAQSARHLQTIIGDLLDLARIESGRLSLDEQRANLRDLVGEVAALQAAVAEDKGLRFGVRFGDSLPAWIRADAPRVKQVLHNLLGNAVKFTTRGEVGLEVDLDGAQLTFVVRDTGPGIAAERIEQIFLAFEQAQPSDQREPQSGTGLGLTISRELARAMGGDVVGESVLGQGATFRLTMPCHRLPDAPPEPTDAVLPHNDVRLTGHVLLVEDNPVNALIARTMLENLGLSVEQTADGQSALHALERAEPAIVLMDCQMPVLDGWQATRRWRALETRLRRTRIPIIALTANAVVGDRERCIDAGMDDYLAKPIELADLARVLQRHLPLTV